VRDHSLRTGPTGKAEGGDRKISLDSHPRTGQVVDSPEEDNPGTSDKACGESKESPWQKEKAGQKKIMGWIGLGGGHRHKEMSKGPGLVIPQTT